VVLSTRALVREHAAITAVTGEPPRMLIRRAKPADRRHSPDVHGPPLSDARYALVDCSGAGLCSAPGMNQHANGGSPTGPRTRKRGVARRSTE
jgi:hypothetical protein